MNIHVTTIEEVIERLDALGKEEAMGPFRSKKEQLFAELRANSNERRHVEADRLLLEALRIAGRQDVVDAYNRVRQRVDFWYA